MNFFSLFNSSPLPLSHGLHFCTTRAELLLGCEKHGVISTYRRASTGLDKQTVPSVRQALKFPGFLVLLETSQRLHGSWAEGTEPLALCWNGPAQASNDAGGQQLHLEQNVWLSIG